MAEKLLDGWSFIRIADWLNGPYTDPRCTPKRHMAGCQCRETGALTNMDRARKAKGHEPDRALDIHVSGNGDALCVAPRISLSEWRYPTSSTVV